MYVLLLYKWMKIGVKKEEFEYLSEDLKEKILLMCED